MPRDRVTGERVKAYALPRLRDLLFIVVLAAGLLLGMRMLNTDGDLGRHLVLGNYILDQRRVPTTDILSYTKAGEPRPPYEWLSQVLFAVADRLLGLDGVVLLTALAIAAAFAVVFADAFRRSGAPIISVVMSAWAAMASSLHWLARPHVFSFVLFAVWLAMLERLHKGERQPLWQFPALMLVWANLHGGFVYGFLALTAYAAGWLVDRWRGRAERQEGRGLLMAGAASLVASVVTPDLWHNWEATLNNRSGYVLARTVETMPLNVATPNAWPFLAMLVLALGLMLIRWRQLVAAHALLLAGLGAMSLLMARNIPLFVIAAAPPCSEWLRESLQRLTYWVKVEDKLAEIDRGLRGLVWPAVVLAAAAVGFAYHRAEQVATTNSVYAFSPQVFPVGAADWLEQNPPQGRMFNDFNWGGYLLYRMWPEQKVFIDSQSDFYGEAFVRRYAQLVAGEPGWADELTKDGVAWIIVPPSVGIAEAARSSAEWRVVFEDETAVVIERR